MISISIKTQSEKRAFSPFPSPSAGKEHFRSFLGPLLFVHLLNLLFHDPNGLVEAVGVATHSLDFSRRKPLSSILPLA